MNDQMAKRRCFVGFTLIELLVVIAIIGLLLAIIVPAIQIAKMKAKMVICGSNQRQLVYGLITYTSDNDGKFPLHPTMTNATNTARHRPFELNWNRVDNNNQGLVNHSAWTEYQYPYVGRYMVPYLPDAGVFNCSVSGIDNDTPWPPPTSDKPPEGTYGEFYQNGNYAPLHSTYTLLWRYNVPGDLSLGLSEFEGPIKIGDKNTLVIQDSLFITTSNTNVLFSDSQDTWFSSHWYKESEKALPYFAKKDTSFSWIPPEVKLNAGYSDGHVSRFNSMDTKLIQNKNVYLRLTRMYR